MHRRLLLVLMSLIVVAACTAGGDPTTTSSPAETTTSTGAPDETTTSSVGSSDTTEAAAPTTTAPDLSGLEGLSDEVKDQLEALIGTAQEIRGLPFLSHPNIKVVSEEELENLVRVDIEDQSEDFPADDALYKMLGLLNDAANFEQILLDLYGEQVAGFYDGDTGEIVVPARDDGFTVLQQGTIVHELVHAITDQHFSFHDTFQAMIDEERLDEASAYQALIEGDATLAEVMWVQTLSQSEVGEFIAQSLDVDSTALSSAPRFLTESLLFPYDTGLSFAQGLFFGGDWADVNDAYPTLAGLPASTEQVITPDDYTRDLPVTVEIPSVSLNGYELERTSVWGELGFRLMLNQGEGVETMAAAADGWGGDSYHQWFDGQNAALLIVYQGDTQADVDELEEALLDFALEDFPEDHFAWVDQIDGNLYFIAADETPIGEQIRAAVGLD
jgi:hypothetical protein